MDTQRQKRKKEIQEALNFIQSSVPYPDPESYKDFLMKLICNLLEEGNNLFRDGHWKRAVRQYSEGLNVSEYFSVEGFEIPQDLVESLYVNRATAYHSMNKYDNCIKDCDKALELCKKSHKVFYLKALCLKQLGRYEEAYDCTRNCLLIAHQDKKVNELAEELVNHLGLKKQKPSKAVSYNVGNVQNPLSRIAPVSFPSVPQCVALSNANDMQQSAISNLDRQDTMEDCELLGDDLDNLLDCVPNEHLAAEVHNPKVASPPSGQRTFLLPAPRPQLPPAFFCSSMSQFNPKSSLSFGGHNSLDALDDLSAPQGPHSSDNLPGGGDDMRLKSLDSLDDLLMATACGVSPKATQPKTNLEQLDNSFDDLLDKYQPVRLTCDPSAQLDSLDSLDSFPARNSVPVRPPKATNLDSLSNFNSSATQTSVSNPLWATHDFTQACWNCIPHEGQGVHPFTYKPEPGHNCKRDILLCRRKTALPSEWTRVRQPPTWTFITGPFLLCKHHPKYGDLGICKFGEKCNYAYNQLEIDVWTQERKGTLDRNLLFGPSAVADIDPVNSIIRLRQEHKGNFIFLCQECYDSKPRIISRRCRDNHTVCSNVHVHHSFDANKCLAFEVKTTQCNYRKVRPFNILAHFKLCSQKSHDGCLGESKCHNAHSVIELQTWKVQRDTGITADEIVKVSAKYDKEEQNAGNERKLRSSRATTAAAATNGVEILKGKSLNMKMKFICASCFQDGHISTPDVHLKYCSNKARHPWMREQSTLVVKSLDKNKWVPARPLPTKYLPAQYQLCAQMLAKKKCDYADKCSFAHSPEEKEMWMYMKTQNVIDMLQIYKMWLTLSAQNCQADKTVPAQEKDIVMPTDNPEPMCGIYCPLCGKHSNGERQWQQHISSAKHKERLFSCEGEDEALKWTHRFPGVSFQLCTKSEADCPEGASCDFAHSREELQEWIERRNFLRRKLDKAREDLLIMPDDDDYGQYNFLLQH
ncbi:zinc finger CCCH domain-containing protein 7B-like isoform X2 [Syngnathus acus]|uniref:zinc finger CCCH domain-containing protein 7B-like isoform X2 n=1 Tax=Syngnathus acus TaxID=161584 RepID=UPI0018863B51|nr:zinc finger CCCH domain-containing protein 7B-like isoform X2 [Syngnathus acus]